MSHIPDLNGRWEGQINRDNSDACEFVIEIIQTYTKINYYVYTKDGNGSSTTCSFITDDLKQKYTLISTWKSSSRNFKDNTKWDNFDGFSQMVYSENDGKKVLNDIYYKIEIQSLQVQL